MKAVNLIPSDAQRASGRSLRLAPATYGLLGVLLAALVLVTMYVLAGNSVSSRRSQLSALQAQVSTAQNEANALSAYTQFTALAQTRVQTVRGIAATRFDWYAALSNLARVIPTDTSLQSLTASVVPGAGAGGGGTGNGLRADLPGPAFELVGCASSHVDVARLISRLRTMPDVVRVALSSSASSSAQHPSGSTGGSATGGCRPGAPVFNLVVFFQPVTGAGPTGAVALDTTTASAGVAK